jgi:hypothetical protein
VNPAFAACRPSVNGVVIVGYMYAVLQFDFLQIAYPSNETRRFHYWTPFGLHQPYVFAAISVIRVCHH